MYECESKWSPGIIIMKHKKKKNNNNNKFIHTKEVHMAESESWKIEIDDSIDKLSEKR